MKKTLLLALLMAAGLTANAQLADGSVAPDFTAVDINGNEHKLSTYLAQGKTVILDISATWCGPCWSFHQSHALADLYQSYGPGGSNELVVLFVEGDPATTLDNIRGINVAGLRPTQGNWTEGSPYPIIDNAAIADLYSNNYFPTLYRICPNGILNEIDPMLAEDLKADIIANCEALTGVQNHAEINDIDERLCELTGSAQATVKNFGTNAITAGTLVLKEGTTVVATQNFTGTIAQYASAKVTFEEVEFNPTANYSVEITQINGAAPFSNLLTSKDLTVIPNAADGTIANKNVQVKVYTDNYPGEISWRIKGSDGSIAATGGPYRAGTSDQWGGGGPDANTTKVHDVVLPGVDCYSVEIMDSFSDGWRNGNTPHGIEVFSAGQSVFKFLPGTATFDSITSEAAFKSNGVLNTPSLQSEKFAVYPNPTNGILNFSTQEAVNVTIIDVTGKVVYTATNINDGGSVNLSSLQKGMYIAKIKGAASERIEKIILK